MLKTQEASLVSPFCANDIPQKALSYQIYLLWSSDHSCMNISRYQLLTLLDSSICERLLLIRFIVWNIHLPFEYAGGILKGHQMEQIPPIHNNHSAATWCCSWLLGKVFRCLEPKHHLIAMSIFRTFSSQFTYLLNSISF